MSNEMEKQERPTPQAQIGGGGGGGGRSNNEASTPEGGSGKKRHAGADFRQSRDEGSDDDEDMPTGTGEFEKADAAVLKQRRIVKAKRPGGMSSPSAGEGEGKGAAANPFATISLTAPPPASAPEAKDTSSQDKKKDHANEARGDSTSSPAASSAPVFGSSFPKVNAASLLSSSSGFGGGGGFGGGFGSAAAGAEGGGSFSRPGSGPGLGSAPIGFASYKLNPFAATAGGTNAASSSAASGDGTTIIASGFASSPNQRRSPFELAAGDATMMAATKSTFGGGGASAGADDEDVAPEDLEAEPNVTFDVPKGIELKDASYVPVTGEEGETCILQLRTKLYRLTEIKKDTTPSNGGPTGPSTATPNGTASVAAATAAATVPAPVRRDWVEAGVGQVKILVARRQTTSGGDVEGEEGGSSSSKEVAIARVVMRRDPGTSVLLNLLLKDPVGVAKHADKALRLTCLEQGKPNTFLLKFKQNVEMEQMLKDMEKQLAAANGSSPRKHE